MGKHHKRIRRQRREWRHTQETLIGMLTESSARGDSLATSILEDWIGPEAASYGRYLVRGPLALLPAIQEEAR